MSSITPLLDTLLHQVAKQTEATQRVPRGTLPVAPLSATATTTEFSRDGTQFARMLSRVSELQQQLFRDRPQAPITPGEPLKLQSGSVAVLAAQLKYQFERSGIFYEQQLRQWLGEAIPLKSILQQPQNSNPSQRQELLFKQFELIQTGIYRFEFALDEQRLLFGAIQPDIHPLLQQFRQGRPAAGTSSRSRGWTCELYLQDARHGDFKLRLRMESRQLHIELQGEAEWMQLLQKNAQELQQRLRQQRFSVGSIQFRSAVDET